jgi:SLT domain-containing protein
LESQNSYNQAKLNSIADSSSDRKKGQQLTALGKQSSDVSRQIQAYQKKGKKPPKDLVSKYNNINNQIDKLIGGMSFSDGSSGTAKIGSMGTYGNYWKTQKEFAHSAGAQTFVNRLDTVVKGGKVPQSWMKGMIELAGRESSWNSGAKNGSSTAHGYAQFLNSTEALYKRRYPNLDYRNPTDQIVLMYHYIKDKYGTVNKALAFWDAHNWY